MLPFKSLVTYAALIYLVSPACGMNNHEQRNFNTISKIYNTTVYPNQLPILEQGVSAIPSGLFSENVTGRVDPLGNYTGLQDSVEYFFALTPVPQSSPNNTAISGFEIVEFSSACPSVAASVVYLTTSVVNLTSQDNGKYLSSLKQVSVSPPPTCGI